MAQLPFDKILTNVLDKIIVNSQVRKENVLINLKGEEIKWNDITQKIFYEEALLRINSQVKLVNKLRSPIDWEEVWNGVHNLLSTNETKTIIWQQIHLNFYTQYSYNKWHKTQQRCPLCLNIPNDIFTLYLIVISQSNCGKK